DEDAVACGLHDAPAVLRDFWIDDRAPVVLECGQRAFLIHAHQPRIACDIPRENGREAALDPFSAQSAPPKGGRHELCLVRFAAVCSGGTRGSTSRGLRNRIEPARGCGVERRAFKPRRRACIAPSLWQSLHWRPACFLPRGASRLASAAAPARSARAWQASRPPPRRSHRWEAALRRGGPSADARQGYGHAAREKAVAERRGGVLPRLHAWSVRRWLGQFLRLFLLRPLNIGHNKTALQRVPALSCDTVWLQHRSAGSTGRRLEDNNENTIDRGRINAGRGGTWWRRDASAARASQTTGLYDRHQRGRGPEQLCKRIRSARTEIGERPRW